MKHVNKQLLDGVEKELGMEPIDPHVNEPPPLPRDSLREAMDRVDATDLQAQVVYYNNILDLEANKLSDQLRHRAAMMRVRANEFDEMADDILRKRKIVSDGTYMFQQLHEATTQTLAEYSHIKPTKVTNDVVDKTSSFQKGNP